MSLDCKKIVSEFKRTVKMISEMVGHNHSTTNFELDKIGKKLFGKQWGGAYPEDFDADFENKKKRYYIYNTDKSNEEGTHWVALYCEHETDEVFVFDTFNRQISRLMPETVKEIRHDGYMPRKGTYKVLQGEEKDPLETLDPMLAMIFSKFAEVGMEAIGGTITSTVILCIVHSEKIKKFWKSLFKNN